MAYRGGNSRAHLLGGAAMLALLSAGGVAAAQESAQFNIAPQPLTSALNEFAVQSPWPILYTTQMTGDKRTAGVSGATDPELALNTLLAGTGLGYRREGDTFLIVKAASDPQSGSAAGDGAEVEALIVTAQKREEDIQDVPIAISAFTQEDLTKSQVTGGPDLITQVPNMTFTKTNFSSYTIQLRGIGTQAISATTDPAVAVAFNNTPFIRNRFFEQEFYDLQRVEVLRGPQGTLYGRNATAGVVNIISQKPKFIAEAKGSADVGNYSSTRIEGMVNIPLVEDAVALRLAGAWTKRDGYVTNELSGDQTDGRDLWSTRVSLRVTPNDRLDVNLIWEHFQEDDDRLRSGKQLCNKDVVDHVGDVPVTNYYGIRGGGGQGGTILSGTQATFSQGCERNSLYDKGSFQRPNGLMLPYYFPLGSIGLPVALTDPYVSVLDPTICSTITGCDPQLVNSVNDQPEDLRVIQSIVEPHYRAKSDIGELQISFDLTDSLTLNSETAYAVDFVHSLQDFNRFNTAPGAWAVSYSSNPYDPTNQPTDAFLRGVLDENGVFCDPQLGCSDRLMAVDLSTAKATQFSQELRLASDFDGPFNFSLGANFLRADSEDKYYVFFNSTSLIAAAGPPFAPYGNYIPGVTDNHDFLYDGFLEKDPSPDKYYSVQGAIYIDPNPINSLNDQGHNYFLSKNPYKLISYAVFGEAYYNITENLKLTAGLRWTVDKKEAPRIPSWIVASQSVGYPVAEVIRQEWREPTGRLTVDWKPDLGFTDETMVYASYAHGYKAGGANPPGYVRALYGSLIETASATRPTTFDPEFINAFEVGAKNTLADGHVTVNLAGFYYDYTDYQISEIVDRSAFNRNFDATVWGIELESSWRPLENLKFGLKGGYEKTRIADGEQAIDLMDRTAGNPDWIVVRPFPTYASSCILPAFVYANPNGTIGDVGAVGGGGPGGCELAYAYGWDPVTAAPYVDLAAGGVPVQPSNSAYWWNTLDNAYAPHPGYPGWDPATAPNHGEGFFKPLGGNELPNAPHWTATITGDYTVPLPNDWLATLHTDLHWQSQSWWRVFNDHEYDKLHPYFTMNLAAIFTNEERGWNIMAYVKNVTDETAISGAFLNSDDTGLTTNVFLTEPRLYGLRVTKNWSGGSLWGSFGSRREGPYPLTVELSGQAQRHDAPTEALMPGFADAFPAPLDVFAAAQNEKLDWGDGREVKVTYRPNAGPWLVSAGARFGKTNADRKSHAQFNTDVVCIVPYSFVCDSQDPSKYVFTHFYKTNHADGISKDHEDFTVVDFTVGRNVGFGAFENSIVRAGLRHAEFGSKTRSIFRGIPGWELEDGFLTSAKYFPTTHYEGSIDADRKFEGTGAAASWDASLPLLGDANTGHLDLDWSAGGGILFGRQKASITGSDRVAYFLLGPGYVLGGQGASPPPTSIAETPIGPFNRSKSVTVPSVDVSLGLSYQVDRFKASAGYRWERYFDAIDGGFEEHQSEDRTIDGPYFKLSVGFGG